jgi:serine/threonine protein kinase
VIVVIGEQVSHYEILEKLGGGGMGVVYRARDTLLDRTVALRFLPSYLSADDEAKKRFVQEAKAASALDHTGICTIHEIAETDLFLQVSRNGLASRSRAAGLWPHPSG